jgi:hypothetical protein
MARGISTENVVHESYRRLQGARFAVRRTSKETSPYLYSIDADLYACVWVRVCGCVCVCV